MAYLVFLIKNSFLKAVNFIFGKTRIFITILGWFLIISGFLFLTQPEKARNKLARQGFGLIKGQLLIIAIYLALLLISFWEKAAGILPKILILIGLAVIIKGFLVLKKNVYNKMKEQLARVPIKFLKIFAFIQITVGILMLMLQKRIW